MAQVAELELAVVFLNPDAAGAATTAVEEVSLILGVEGAVRIGIDAVQCSSGDQCQCAIEFPPVLILFINTLP